MSDTSIPIRPPLPLLTPWIDHARKAKFNQATLARQFGRSSEQLGRYFAEQLGLPLRRWLHFERYRYILCLLPTLPLKAIIDEVGMRHVEVISHGLRDFFGVGTIRLRKEWQKYLSNMHIVLAPPPRHGKQKPARRISAASRKSCRSKA